ncbi:phage tail length tape-measure protein [Pseudoalteromonas sp. SW0106-04]|uniref:tape measure protein n=1 Tax=Pseudoalteromonas sp. SW0106-04 TaxID=1702169 RepID=UPI0006B4CA79|nr:tape measure protein [Pseudoalteromonas sp. SW0106-04]GAP76994.1 phage tail length tape-measure protein [Pseudoalteromonas sp. SW0106-04]
MSFKNTVVEFIIKGRDLFTPSADKAQRTAQELERTVDIMNERLSDIEGQQAALKRFDELNNTLGQTEEAYKQASVELEQYKEEQKLARSEVKELNSELRNAETTLADLERQERNSTTTNNQLQRDIEQQRQAVERLRQSRDKSSRSLADHNLKVKQARSESGKLGTTLNKNKAEFEKLNKTLGKTEADLSDVSNELQELERQQNAAKASIASATAKLEKQRDQMERASKSAGDYGGSIRDATRDLVAFAAAYVGLDKFKESLLGVLSAGDRAEAFATQMTSIMGSIEAGEQATQWINEFANKTGTNLEQARESFVKLKAFGLDPMAGSMQSLIDYNALLGGSQEKLNGIILAVGQAWAKQKLQGEEILQLVERGVPVWDMLAEVTGKNTIELQKLSSQGQLGRDVIRELFEEMGRQSEGQAARSLERLSGQVTLLSNKWEQFKMRIADSGVYRVAIQFMTELNAQFDRMVNDGTIDRAAQKISDFFTAIIRDGGASIKSLIENVDALLTGAERVVGAMRIVWNGFTAGIKTAAMVSTEYAGRMTDAFASALDFVGADEWAQKAQHQANALKAVSDGFHQGILQDGRDLDAAWQQFNQTGQTRTRQQYQQTTQTVKTELNKQTQAAKQTTDALKKATTTAATDISVLLSKAGITSTESLLEQQEQAKSVYEQVKELHAQGAVGVYELEQAYMKWAEAAINTSTATRQGIPPTVEAAAAALGLSNELRNLIAQAEKLAPVADNNSAAVTRFKTDIASTTEAIEQNRLVLASNTATTLEKAQAQEYLTEQEQRLELQTQALNEVMRAEESTLFDLELQKERLQERMDMLNGRYEAGTIRADEYRFEKDQIGRVLRVVNELLGDFSNRQERATDATKQGTRATKEQAKAARESARELDKQSRALDKVASSAQSASSNSYYPTSGGGGTSAMQSGATPNQSRATRSFTTYDVKAERSKRLYEEAIAREYQKFASDIAGATSLNELSKLYNRINNMLTYVSREQKRQLTTEINNKRQQIKAQQEAARQARILEQQQQRQAKQAATQPTPPLRYSEPAATGAPTELVEALNGFSDAVRGRGEIVRLQVVFGDELQELLALADDGFISKLEQIQETT